MAIFQPFEPEDDTQARKKLRQHIPSVPVRVVIPNLVTLLALCAGLTSIRMTIEARFDWAIYAVAIAAALDGIDGRVARMLKSTSRFGAELDSLSDFVNFGIAPAMLLYVWSLDEAGAIGWGAALIFAVCAALRLARFNAALLAPKKPEWQGNFFTGVPAPAGAMVVFLPIYLEFLGAPHGFLTAPLVIIYTLFIAMLMVSRIPSWSAKMIGRKIPRDLVLLVFVVPVAVVVLLFSYPWLTMTVLTLMYLGALPFSWRSFRKKRSADKVAVGADDDTLSRVE